MSAVTQALQNLATPGSASGSGLSSAAVGNVSGLAASGVSSPASALSSLTSASGKTAKTAGAAGVLSSLSGILSSLGSNGVLSGIFDIGGVAGDVSGLGTDSAASVWTSAVPVWTSTACNSTLRVWIRYQEPPVAPPDWEASRGWGLLAVWEVWTGSRGRPGSSGVVGYLVGAPSWADAVSMTTPIPLMDANAMPGGWGAAPSLATGPTVSKLPLGGMVGRESDGAVQRVGFSPSLIPRSPVAG